MGMTRFQTKKRSRAKNGEKAPFCSRPIFRAARIRKLLRAARTSFALLGNACYAGYKLILSLTLHQNTYQAFPCDNQSSKVHTALDWLTWDKGHLLKSIQEKTLNVACVASVLVRSERKFGPRKGVFHIRAARNIERAKRWKEGGSTFLLLPHFSSGLNATTRSRGPNFVRLLRERLLRRLHNES